MRRRASWACLLVVLLVLVAAPSAAQAGARLRIQADLEGEVSTVKGIVPGTRLKVTVFARDGSVLRQEVRWPDQTERVVTTGLLEPGMQVVARNTGRIVRMRVLDIAPRIDRVSDLMTGVAPPGSRVEVVAIHVPRGGEPDKAIQRTIEVDDDGRWRWDTSARLDLLGGDSTFVTVRTDDYALFVAGAVPFMSANVGSSAVFGCDLDRERPVTFTLRAPDHAVKATATWTSGPRCHPVTLRDEAWEPRIVRVGDTLRGDFAEDARLVTEPLHLRPDASEDTATGRCPSAGWWSTTRRGRFEASGPTGDGRFVVARGALGDLRAGEFVALTCTASTGDSLAGGGVTAP